MVDFPDSPAPNSSSFTSLAIRFSSWRRTLSSSREWASPSSFLFRAPKHIVVLCGHSLAVVVSKCRKEYAKAELPWSRVHGSSALRKVLGQRAADFFFFLFRCRFFFIMRKCVRPGRHDDYCKRRKGRRLATKVAAVLQQATVRKCKESGASKAASVAFDPYVSRSWSKCCAKSPCQSPRSLSTRRLCTSDVRQSSLFVVDRERKGIREIRAPMEKRRRPARKSNSTEQGHNQDQASPATTYCAVLIR